VTLSLLDTTILSNFAHAQRPDLVQSALGDQAVTTATVLAELRQGEALGLVPHVDWRWLPALTLTAEEQALAVHYQDILDAGEAECLAVAVTRGCHFLSDDLAARRLARAYHVTISGTLGLLLYLVHQSHLTAAADTLLDLMRQHGYRAPITSLQVYMKE
jgi:predicted nucleic acid-binding protein